MALVTGAAGGIGRCTARALADGGDRVALLDVDGDAAATVARELERAGGRAIAVAADVADEDAVDAALGSVERSLGTVEVLVNCAALTSSQPTVAETLDLHAWRRTLDVNLTGALITARRVARTLLAAGRPGVIVNIGSVYGARALDHRLYDPSANPARYDDAAYHVSKAGLIQLTRVLAVSWAPFGIRVVCVSPGPTDTELVRSTIAPDARERIAARVPVGRLAEPEEIAAAVVWLASAGARYVTGSELVVDGGFTCW